MKRYQTNTANGGQTVILDDLTEAIQTGQQWVQSLLAQYSAASPSSKVRVAYRARDSARKKCKTISAAKLLDSYRKTAAQFGECIDAITRGNEQLRAQIDEITEQLQEMVQDMEPRLSLSPQGFERAEEGVTTTPELCASGDPACCLRSKPGERPQDGQGEGAYRIIVNTDVSWWGDPAQNAAVMGALIVILQRFRPVEVWIQHGWLGGREKDGVTLFKLDFSGAFEPTQLSFWLGHPLKDAVFSFVVNRGLGRSSFCTAKHAEIASDLYLRGDWMMSYGINPDAFLQRTHLEKLDIMAKWLADTALKIVYKDNAEGFAA